MSECSSNCQEGASPVAQADSLNIKNKIMVLSGKGGVGKTAAAVNLAYLASRDGRRTLLWDLDPQGAALAIELALDPATAPGVAVLPRHRALDWRSFEGGPAGWRRCPVIPVSRPAAPAPRPGGAP